MVELSPFWHFLLARLCSHLPTTKNPTSQVLTISYSLIQVSGPIELNGLLIWVKIVTSVCQILPHSSNYLICSKFLCPARDTACKWGVVGTESRSSVGRCLMLKIRWNLCPFMAGEKEEAWFPGDLSLLSLCCSWTSLSSCCSIPCGISHCISTCPFWDGACGGSNYLWAAPLYAYQYLQAFGNNPFFQNPVSPKSRHFI